MQNLNTPTGAASMALSPSAPFTAADTEFLRTVLNKFLPSRKAVYLAIKGRFGADGIFPSIQTIAADSGVSPATVKRAIADLREAAIIAWDSRFRADGGRTSNSYTILQGDIAPREKQRRRREPSPRLKMSHKEHQTPEGVIIEPPRGSEPLTAAEVEQLRQFGVHSYAIRALARNHAAGCRHAFQFAAKSKWFRNSHSQGAAIVAIAKEPHLYPLEPSAPSKPTLPTAWHDFLAWVPEYRRRSLSTAANESWNSLKSFVEAWVQMTGDKRDRAYRAIEDAGHSPETAISGVVLGQW